jgi:MoaA/NifB/PqqE/SkfB family radical SAM enzyme
MKIMHISPLESHPCFSDLIEEQKKKQEVIFVKLSFAEQGADYGIAENADKNYIEIKNARKICDQSYDEKLRMVFDSLLKKYKPDLVHIQVFSGISLLPILNVASSLGIKKVLCINDIRNSEALDIWRDYILNQCDALICPSEEGKNRIATLFGANVKMYGPSRPMETIYGEIMKKKPMDLSLRVSYECNQNCIYCAFGDIRGNYQKEHVDFRKINDALKRNRAKYDILELTTSSEPTILKDFFKIVNLAYRLGYQIELVTNGRMFCYEDFCKRVSSYNIRLIVITMYSNNPAIHDAITRVDGSFKQATAGIKNLRKYGFNVLIQIILTKINYRYLLNTAKFILDLGITNIRFTFLDPYGSAKSDFFNVVPKYSEVLPQLNQALEWLESLGGINVDLKSFPYCCINQEFRHLVARGINSAVITLNEGGIPFYITKIERMLKMKQKFGFCNRCSYNKECEGVWKNYASKYSIEEFKPIK